MPKKETEPKAIVSEIKDPEIKVPMINGRPKTMEEMTREEMIYMQYPLDVIDDIHPL